MSLMKVGSPSFNEAIAIICKVGTKATITINEPVRDNYGCTHAILIHAGYPALISALIKAGYSLGMCDKGLYVNKL